jgi:siroheme synthase-like protein
MVEGASITALVVGGGRVATRKALALASAGAAVRVVAPELSPELRAAATRNPRLALAERAYDAADVDDAVIVVAATGSREVNARVARDATALRRLVNVADAPEDGNCATAATHRAGDLVIAVSAGGVPTAAARIRDCLGARFDGRYGTALSALVALRRRILFERGSAAWRAASAELTGPEFCAAVEDGSLAERVASWR